MMISCRDIYKIYSVANGTNVSALRGCDFFVNKGEMVSIIGPSGAGKSTLLRILGLLEIPTSGYLEIQNEQIHLLSTSERINFRKKHIAFTHQHPFLNLHHEMSVIDNMRFIQTLNNVSNSEAILKSKKLLQDWNLKDLTNTPVKFLSMGEALRISILTAISKDPIIILADEPTGLLDPDNTRAIQQFLCASTKECDITTIVVTHDPSFEEWIDHSFLINDGRLSSVYSASMDKNERLKSLENAEELIRTEYKGYIDSTRSTTIPNPIYEFLNLDKYVLYRKFANSRVEIVNPNCGDPNLPRNSQENHTIKEKKNRVFEKNLGDIQKFFELKQKFQNELQNSVLIKVEQLSKSYRSNQTETIIFNGISFEVHKGEVIAIRGPSGIGKTTLLKILSGIIPSSNGNVFVFDKEVSSLSSKEILKFRRNQIGFLSHFGGLHPDLSILENLYFKLSLNQDIKEVKFYIEALLTVLDLPTKGFLTPRELSGGEKRRAELAMAILNLPPLLLLDEPSANLDSDLTEKMIKLLLFLSSKFEMTIVFTTHDTRISDPLIKELNFNDLGKK